MSGPTMNGSKNGSIEVLGFTGAVLDLDGVITQTAALHFAAWKQTFDNLLQEKQGSGTRAFSHDDDYVPYVDGKPRYDGVASFLESRDIELPFGDPSDQPGTETICGVGNTKNQHFQELVETGDVEVYQSTMEIVDAMKEAGVAVGVASSSKNCSFILEKTGLLPRFDTVVVGNVSKELGLDGKPAPDIFLAAAERMGVSPYDCLMVEDAYSGVEAGRRGGFGLVIGVARSGDRDGLHARGADIVVGDMSEISVLDITAWFRDGRQKDAWELHYHGFDGTDDRLREALTTVGNGYFASRGVLESEGIDDNRHYPGTYIAGLFDRAVTRVEGAEVPNNDFVNCPNWLATTVRVEDSAVLSPHIMEVVGYRQWLDMRRAVLHRSVTYRDEADRETRLDMRRFASMRRRNVGAMEIAITPLNHDGRLTITTELDGTVRNYGVERYRNLEQNHLEPVAAESRPDGAVLAVRTRNSGHDVVMRSRTRLLGSPRGAERTSRTSEGRISERYTVTAAAGQTVTLEKLVAICSDLESGLSQEHESLTTAAEAIVADLPAFARLEQEHADAWADLWEAADIVIEGDRFAQRVIRLHAYHLLTTASPQTVGLDVGLPAHGLHGEACRGHIFWDELFITPFFLLRFPEVARNHLMYRYRRLDRAKELARESGYAGAMYPWQSADTGEAESRDLRYNPLSREWDRDPSNLQHHVGISVAYDALTYFDVTHDTHFMDEFGLEMLIEIARFWASIAWLDEDDGRYHISGVVGPDEYHEKYPDASDEDGGVRDNAYTNIMASWLIHKTVETLQHRPSAVRSAIVERLGLGEDELEHWREITRRMALVIGEDGVISQFDGFRELEELNWDAYREKYGNVRRMDRILKSEDDSPDRYQVIKQADLLMTFYLLSPDRVVEVIRRMGYEVNDSRELLKTNFEYYAPRTTHGSTLSWVVHAAVLEELHTRREDQWQWYVECLQSDIYDTQRGTTLEGVHCGVMSGSIDMVVSRYAGLTLCRNHLMLDHPELPDAWRRVAFRIRRDEQIVEVELRREEGDTIASIRRKTGGEPALTFRKNGTTYELPVGEWFTAARVSPDGSDIG